MNAEQQHLHERLVAEIASRRREALPLYEPLPEAQRFHRSTALERCIVSGNRGGKSLAAAVEFTRAVCNCDPFGKYPSSGIAVVIGQKEDSLADPIWKILRQPGGAFKVMKDPRTKKWRAVRPWDKFDKDHQDLWKGNDPLLPDRLIKGKISWHVASRQIPAEVRLKTGWKIVFMSGNAEPQKGTILDLAWFNEEIKGTRFYAEISARLIDRNGRFIWDATPEEGTEELYNLYLRSQKGAPGIECFALHMLDNPHVPREQKDAFIEKHKHNPVAYQTKVLGKFAMADSLVYPDFRIDGPHVVPAESIPWNWTRYAAIDPGWGTTGVLFLAVPPPDQPFRLHVYDELYLNHCEYDDLGREMASKVAGAPLYMIYLDYRYGKQHRDMDSQTSVEQVREALARHRVEPEVPGLQVGCDVVKARLDRVRHYLRMQPDGKPGLVFHQGKVPWCLWEMERYRMKKNPQGMLTDEPVGRHDDLMDALGYLCAADPTWAKPSSDSARRHQGVSRDDIFAWMKRQWGGPSRPGSVSMGPSRN